MNRYEPLSAGNAGVTIIRLALIAAVTFLLPSLVPIAPGPAQAGLTAASYALAAVVAILLLCPEVQASLLTTFAWCAIGAALAAAMLLLDPESRVVWPHLPRLVLTLFLLAATFSIATRHAPAVAVTTSFALLTLMPVWAAPLVEVSGNPAWLNQLVVNACPLTAIAVSVELDYLRSGWFYANSALGSMRYSYPGWPAVCSLLAIVPTGALVLEQRRKTPATFVAIRKEAHP